MKSTLKALVLGVLTGIASSLCCITPLLAMISGSAGTASSFKWLETYRPHLVVFTVLVLGFAWYQKLKPKKEIGCNCAAAKPSFFQSKKFLAITTVFAISMTLFPYFSTMFYGDSNKEVSIIEQQNIQTIDFTVSGMTCSACEKHIVHAVTELNGIVAINASSESGAVEIKFDKTKIVPDDLITAINKTGYTVKK